MRIPSGSSPTRKYRHIENLKGNRRSFTAFRMTLLWVEEMVPDEHRGERSPIRKLRIGAASKGDNCDFEKSRKNGARGI